MLIANFIIFRTLVVDKMVPKCRSISGDISSELDLLASSRNSLVVTSMGECQIVAREGVSPDVATVSSRNTFLGNTSPSRISGLPQVLADKILRSTAATSGPGLTLATVCHSPLLPPVNEI